jgi:hypothetical protein
MIESVEEFNYLLERLKEKHKQKKLGSSLRAKLEAFREVEKLINNLNNIDKL